MTNTIILIPARMAASRLSGKPLLDIAGLPMIVQVLRRAEAAKIGEAVVATDSEAVQAAVGKSGGRAVITRADHPSGSDRIYEALEALDPEHRIEIVVNVQGDLPTIDPADIRAAQGPLPTPPSISRRSPPSSRTPPSAPIPMSSKCPAPSSHPAGYTPRPSPARTRRVPARIITTSGFTPTGARRWSASSNCRLPPMSSVSGSNNFARSMPA
jgi:CTP:molybdopterin cytidylyltransferase MocA